MTFNTTLFRDFVREIAYLFPTDKIEYYFGENNDKLEANIYFKSGLIVLIEVKQDNRLHMRYARNNGSDYTPTMLEEKQQIKALWEKERLIKNGLLSSQAQSDEKTSN